MRFQIKKILEGFDPADLIEQSMYCFGSDSSDNDNSGGDEWREVYEREANQITGNFGGDLTNLNTNDDMMNSPNRGRYASPEARDNYIAGQTAIANAVAQGEQLGAGLNNYQPYTPSAMDVQDFARSQDFFDANPMSAVANAPFTSRSADINVGAGDVFGLKNKIGTKLSQGGTPYFDPQGNIIGATGQTPLFGIPFLPNVTTYTGLNSGNPFGDPTIGGDDGDSNSMTVAPTRNPVSGQPVCPDGYRYDDDLQACRLDTTSPNRPNNPNPFPSGDAYYRATSLDQAPVNAPSGFDFNSANQNFVNNFAYRPANFTNQMGLSGFTPFRRS